MHNPENERIKRAYFIYLKEARRLGEHSIDGAAAALAKFEDYTKYRDFKRFIFSRRSDSKAGCPNTSARARANGSAEEPSSSRSMRYAHSSTGSAPSLAIDRI